MDKIDNKNVLNVKIDLATGNYLATKEVGNKLQQVQIPINGVDRTLYYKENYKGSIVRRFGCKSRTKLADKIPKSTTSCLMSKCSSEPQILPDLLTVTFFSFSWAYSTLGVQCSVGIP